MPIMAKIANACMSLVFTIFFIVQDSQIEAHDSIILSILRKY